MPWRSTSPCCCPAYPPEEIAQALTEAGGEARGRHLAALLGQAADALTLDRLDVLLRLHRALEGWRPQGQVEHLHLVQPSAAASPHLDAYLAHGRRTGHSVVPGEHRSMLTGAALNPLAALYPDGDGSERGGR